MKIRCLICWLLLFNAVVIIGAWLANRFNTPPTPPPQTVVIEKPIPIHDTIIRTETVYLPHVITAYDTITETITETITDTVQVQIPITTRQYAEQADDVQVHISVSGFQPTLDKLTVQNMRVCTPQKQRRITVGVGIGYGFGLRDVVNGVWTPQPFVGVTLQWRIF